MFIITLVSVTLAVIIKARNDKIKLRISIWSWYEVNLLIWNHVTIFTDFIWNKFFLNSNYVINSAHLYKNLTCSQSKQALCFVCTALPSSHLVYHLLTILQQKLVSVHMRPDSVLPCPGAKRLIVCFCLLVVRWQCDTNANNFLGFTRNPMAWHNQNLEGAFLVINRSLWFSFKMSKVVPSSNFFSLKTGL